MDWIYLAQDKAQYRLNTVKKLWGFHKIGGDFLSTWGNISFWTKTLLHGVSIPWSWNTGFFRGSLLYSLTSMPFVKINGVLCYGTTSTLIPLEVTWGSSTNAHILIPFELQVLKLNLTFIDQVFIRCGVHKAHIDNVKYQETTLRAATTSWRISFPAKSSSEKIGGRQILYRSVK